MTLGKFVDLVVMLKEGREGLILDTDRTRLVEFVSGKLAEWTGEARILWATDLGFDVPPLAVSIEVEPMVEVRQVRVLQISGIDVAPRILFDLAGNPGSSSEYDLANLRPNVSEETSDYPVGWTAIEPNLIRLFPSPVSGARVSLQGWYEHPTSADEAQDLLVARRDEHPAALFCAARLCATSKDSESRDRAQEWYAESMAWAKRRKNEGTRLMHSRREQGLGRRPAVRRLG